MNNSSPERNKATVLEGFETLFNKRDYAAAERVWSPNYIQHSAHIAPGREGLFDIIRFEEGVLKEHWDVLQDEATKAESVSGLPMFGNTFPK